MAGTKENILMSALGLFAKDGYEAVSVSQIAGDLGMTKGALYRHYKNKRDIFDSIFKLVCASDAERSKKAGIPANDFPATPESFGATSVRSLQAYMESQFQYWTEDDIACKFRRMLTLEQYRNREMSLFYQKVFTSGPVGFLEDLLREMMRQGAWRQGDPKEMAVDLYAPFHLLLSLSDAASNKGERESIAALFTAHMERFLERYALPKP